MKRRLARSRLPILITALVIASLSLVVASIRQPRAPETLNERVYEVASGLRCPVCRNLSVADSPSGLAEEMRATIADKLKEGDSSDQVRAYFVERYGEWVLLSPRPSGIGLIPWVTPALALVAGAVAASHVLKKRRSGHVSLVTESERERIKQELALVQEPE